MDNCKNISDLIHKEITVNNIIINIYSIETITNSIKINDFILRKITYLENCSDIYDYLYNNLPSFIVKKINKKEISFYLVNSYTVIEINNKYLAIDTIDIPNRSVSVSQYE